MSSQQCTAIAQNLACARLAVALTAKTAATPAPGPIKRPSIRRQVQVHCLACKFARYLALLHYSQTLLRFKQAVRLCHCGRVHPISQAFKSARQAGSCFPLLFKFRQLPVRERLVHFFNRQVESSSSWLRWVALPASGGTVQIPSTTFVAMTAGRLTLRECFPAACVPVAGQVNAGSSFTATEFAM